VVVVDGFNMTCIRNILRLVVTLGKYTLTNNFYVVDLVDTNIVLGVKWLHSLGEITINYQVMEMIFNTTNEKKVVLRGMSNGGPKIVSTKRMEALFRHGDISCVTRCLITTWEHAEGRQHHHVDIQVLLIDHDRVFVKIPPRILPDKGFENTIELEEGAKPVITTPYRHPKKFKDEIEKAIKDLLEMGHIRPNSIPFASSIILFKKKDGTMRMCIDYRDTNKKTIKNMYPIPRIDDILDELHGVVYFLKIDI
jgi:hypothetical protein